MNKKSILLKEKLSHLSHEWMSRGITSREHLLGTADELFEWKKDNQIKNIWPQTPVLATATLDDAIGQGIDIIELYAKISGLEVIRIGLLQTPAHILDQCHRIRPDLLGITILQLDSDDDLSEIGHHLPSNTRLIAGGPVFKFDPDMAHRCGVDYVAPNVGYFIDYLLNWCPP